MGRPRCCFASRRAIAGKRIIRRSQETGGVSIQTGMRNAFLSGQPSTPAREGEEETMRLHGLLFLFLIFGFAPFFLSAQTNPKQATATLSGTLTDPSGAVVAGARVTATQAGSIVAATTAMSGADGKFALTLAPGNYRARAVPED